MHDGRDALAGLLALGACTTSENGRHSHYQYAPESKQDELTSA